MEIHYKNPVIFPESFYVEVLDLKELKKKKKSILIPVCFLALNTQGYLLVCWFIEGVN